MGKVGAREGGEAVRFSLGIKPLSVNVAWQGRRFGTKEKKRYENLVAMLLPRASVSGEYFKVAYDFYVVNFAMTDADNLVKVLQDCIVKRGIVPDDRRIIDYRIRKFPAKEPRIDVSIEAVELLLTPQD